MSKKKTILKLQLKTRRLIRQLTFSEIYIQYKFIIL